MKRIAVVMVWFLAMLDIAFKLIVSLNNIVQPVCLPVGSVSACLVLAVNPGHHVPGVADLSVGVALAMVACVAVIWFIIYRAVPIVSAFPLSFLPVVGAWSNFADKLSMGGAVDYLFFYRPGLEYVWIFNLADVYIVFGGLLLVVQCVSYMIAEHSRSVMRPRYV